jgi:hypothetical protein
MTIVRDESDDSEMLIHRSRRLQVPTPIVTNKGDYLLIGRDHALSTDEVVELIGHLAAWLGGGKLSTQYRTRRPSN